MDIRRRGDLRTSYRVRANVASLLLVRNAAVRRGIGDPARDGANEGRLFAAVADRERSSCWRWPGGIFGLALAYGATVHVLVAIGPEALPRLDEIRWTDARWASR